MSLYPWRPTEEQRLYVETFLRNHPIHWDQLAEMLNAPYYAVIEQFSYLKKRQFAKPYKKRVKVRP